MFPSNMALVKLASVGGILTVTMGLAYRWQVNKRVCEFEPYRATFKIVRAHKGAVELLGEPIKDKLVDIGNTEKNYTKDLAAQYEVPVSGTKQRGTVYFWADREGIDKPWKISRIELGLKDEPERRLLISGGVDVKNVL
ncbi:cytochrome c oxidase assembly factor 1 homolog [Onthophagus taurus]|uniref:cytochrome c oxidase assembly factor 1 homolog n=1 Tax=Onthophagus taurus TaxID=166361 RepID=UPI000C209F48|nr:uncharacterized protein LOC111417611 [Onthophagus taurus]XP_022905711.1 uncharacterized protein LOC111417611 [Onthophagus taurus]XP_022905712.1 uncharacterized protein LOC111417611 [Onthophagus taurus]